METIGLTPKSSMEIVGERIGQIVCNELDCDVYYDRIEPVGNDEDLVINVFPARGNYSNRIATGSDVTVEYYLDIYLNTVTTPCLNGDNRSTSKMFGLIGRLNYIFSHPHYRTLGFDLGKYVCEGGVEGWEKQDPAVNQNSDQTAFARVTLSYRIRECYDLESSVPLLANFTNTNKGYKFEKHF